MPPADAPSPLTGVPVLIVDDDPPSAKLLGVVLDAEGCETRIARSAEEALDIMRTFVPRVLVLDLVLPRMSGLLLAQQLKSTPATRDLVIVAVSAFNGPETQRVVAGAGCQAYVRKPIDPIAFPQLLLKHLSAVP
jgi:CheY-like chemotaxis protein